MAMRALAQATLVFTAAYGATYDEPEACQEIIDKTGKMQFSWEMAKVGADPKVSLCFDKGLPGLPGLKIPGIPGLPGAAAETFVHTIADGANLYSRAIVKVANKIIIRRCVSDEDYPSAKEYLLCKASQGPCDALGNMRNPVKIPSKPGIPGIPGVPHLMEKESEQENKDRATFLVHGAVPVPIAGLTAFISAALGAAGMYIILRCQKVGQDAYSKLEDQIQ